MRLGCDLFQCCFTNTTSTSDIFQDVVQSECTIFPYWILAEATNNFDECDCLGKIGLKNVYYGKLRNGREIAIQRCSNDKLQIFQQFLNEIVILNIFPHKNLVSFYGYAFHDEEFLIANEYVSNGTLAAHLQGEIRDCHMLLPLLTRIDIAIDIANALSYLHSHGIVHGSIGSNSILLDEKFCAKVAGVHSLKKLPLPGLSVDDAIHATRDLVGTCAYIDPEYVSHGILNVKIDVYSFGMVLCDLITSKLAQNWEGSGEESIATLLSKKIENKAWDTVLDPRLGFQSDNKIKQMITAMAELAFECLQCPQETRPNMEQVLETLNVIRLWIYDSLKAFKIFDHTELKEATNHFHTKSVLGEGGFSRVFYGKLQDGRKIAVKYFHNETEKSIKHFNKEIEILRHLRHKNLVSLYGSSSSGGNSKSREYLLVYEYISNGTLSKHLCKPSREKLPWLTRLNIAIETATALSYLHDSGIIHRDVKGSNILLDENFTVKVSDFGLSRSLPQYASHASTIPVGTRGYMDPEYLQTGRVSYRSDVYSFGVVLFELISSKPVAWMEDNQTVSIAKFGVSKILDNALEELVDPSLGFDSDKNVMEMIAAVAELAFQCVQCPKELRPSMKQVLETLEGIKMGTWGFKQIT